jgi:protein-disulfide isomerase
LRVQFQANRSAYGAAAQGRFQPYHDSLYAAQSELSEGIVQRLAQTAGVPDTAEFNDCRSRQNTTAAIDRSRTLALRLGGTGTPAFAVNAVFYPTTPSDAQRDSIIRSALEQRK